MFDEVQVVELMSCPLNKMGWRQDFICGGSHKVLFQLCDPLNVSLFRNGKIYRYTGERELKGNKDSYVFSCYTTDFPTTAHINGKVV